MSGKDAVGTVMNDSAGAWVGRTLSSIPASYTVFYDNFDGVYRAEANKRSGTDYSDASASTVIQSAFDALTVGRIWKEKVLLKGNFSLGASSGDYVAIPNYSILELQGNITTASTEAILQVSAKHDIEIRGGILHCGGLTDAIYGINATYNILVDGVHIIDAKTLAQGIYLRGYNIWVQNSHIDGAGVGILIGRSESDPFTSYNVWITNNLIKNTHDDGIALDLVIDGHVSHNIIDRNNLTDVAGSSGIKIYGACRNAIITENTIENVGSGTFGINNDIDSDNGLVEGLIATENTVTGISTTNTRGILFAGTAAFHPIKGIIKNNTISGVAQGIRTYYAYDSVVKDNRISGCTTPIYREGNVNVKFKDNYEDVTESSGTSTGTGAQQTIAHGCNFTPSYDEVFLSERSTGLAIPYQSAAPDATNIYVTATNAKTYNWKVEQT